MSKQTFKVNQVCQSCGGTGLYVGMAERDGAAVVCSSCKGTGCQTFVHEYEVFEKRKERKGIKRVYKTNPGICIGEGNNCKLEDFGGMPYQDWNNGKDFPKGSENRKYTCPAWWYQSENYELKPKWKECIGFGSFSSCKNFKCKEKCWKKWDKENE